MNTGKKSIVDLISLGRFGARYQVELSIALIAVVPVLSVLYIASTYYMATPSKYMPLMQLGVVLFASILSACGYIMLRRYPVNIERLRYNLGRIAEGELPQSITLIKSEDDISAIEDYLNIILEEMRKRIKVLENQLDYARKMKVVIQSQSEEILEAERHRVMIQSIGAACHHIGQPLTVLQAYLDLVRREERDHEVIANLSKCQGAVDTLSDVLDKLRHVSEYRTIPYQTFCAPTESSDDASIIDIEP